MSGICANPKCRESLYMKVRVARGDGEFVRTGYWLCPACWYFGKRVFGVAVATTGVVCGVIWWIVNHL